MKYHLKKSCLTLTTALSVMTFTMSSAKAETLRLMAYNILNAGGNQAGFAHTIDVMKKSKADIIAISEVREDSSDENNPGPTGKSIAKDLADAMGYYYFDQSEFYEADKKRTNDHPAIWANAILSKYPITETSAIGYGAAIDVNGRKVYVFSLNLDYKPYPPYQINNIEYENYPFIKTEKEAIKYANIAHGKAMKFVTKEIKQWRKKSDAIFVMGDFNEPSHLDWTDAAVLAKYHPVKVAWPTTKKLEKMGFVDSYRAIYPDAVAKPAFTWTPTTKENDPEDHHDRIDYIFAWGKDAKKLKIINSWIYGEKNIRSDVAFPNWVSDHRAVVTELEF